MGGLFSFWFSPSSKYDIAPIEVGRTSKAEVLARFGKPENVVEETGCGDEWEYTVPFRIYVAIEFDNDGIVKRKHRSGEPAA